MQLRSVCSPTVWLHCDTLKKKKKSPFKLPTASTFTYSQLLVSLMFKWENRTIRWECAFFPLPKAVSFSGNTSVKTAKLHLLLLKASFFTKLWTHHTTPYSRAALLPLMSSLDFSISTRSFPTKSKYAKKITISKKNLNFIEI